MNFYSIRHLTRFRYSQPISESIMETRMHPRSDSSQHCLTFSLSVSPRCRVFTYRDHLGNNVHHFDIPGEHNQLVIIAESVVEQQPMPDVPGFLVARCLERARRPDRSRRLLGDAAPEQICRRDPGTHPAGSADGSRPAVTIHSCSCRNSISASSTTSNMSPDQTRVDSPIDDAIVAERASARTSPTP